MSAVEAIKQWFHEQWRASLDEVVRGRAKIWKAARWKLRDRYETGKCKGAEATKGRKGGPVTPTHSPGVSTVAVLVMLWDVFSRSTQTCIQFSSFFSTPLFPPLPLQNCRLYSKAGLFTSFRTASPSLGSSLGGTRECRVTDAGPQGRAWLQGLTRKLGLCVTSMIPRSGSRKGSWEARGPSAFHRIQQCLSLSTFQGYLKPNPLGSAPSSATWPSESPLVNPFPLWASASQYTMGGGGRGGLDKITSSWSPS